MLAVISVFLILGFTSILIRSSSAKSEKHNEESARTFWEKERDANFVRKKDISNLPYITIPLDTLPFHDTDNSNITMYQDTIKKLAEKKILNLSNQTNTELKLQYGAANLPFLMDCDTRYTELIKTLQLWGKTLFDSNNPQDAKIVLEFAIACKTDIAASYSLLGDIYALTNNTEQIKSLLESAKEINSPRKNNIISHLENILCK
jgi:tetratricopeptide (TPR) repeat protein